MFANDNCAKKAQSYRDNWGEADLHVADVFDLRTEQLPGHADLAWGSFPCQDLSLAGNGRGLSGERSGAFWGFWKLVKQLRREGRKPRTVVLENVYGTLTSHDGKDFEQIAKAVEAEGYQLGALVVDAVHFVPQSRPRLFVVGVDSALTLPASTYSAVPSPAWHPDAVIKAYNRLSNRCKAAWVWWTPAMPGERLRTMDDIVEHAPRDVAWHSDELTTRLLDMMSPLNRRKVMEAQASGTVRVGTIYRRTRNGVQRAEVRFDGISGCLRTPAGGSSRQTILVIEKSKVRSRLISPREMARLMGLDEKYILPSKYNDAYHLLGDGVVVPVVAHLRTHLLEPTLGANVDCAKSVSRSA